MSKEILRPAIFELYSRLANSALREDDIVTLDEVSFVSSPQWIKGLYDENRIFDEDARVFARFRKEMGTILDIGAHWGYMALSIRCSGTDCPILSFEAMEGHGPCLEELKRLDCGNYDFSIGAVSDETTTRTIYGPVVNGLAVTGLNCVDGKLFHEWHGEYLASFVGSVIPVADSYKVQLLETKFQTRSIDEILAQSKFDVPTHKIAGMKVVVEGHEDKVVMGAAKTIDRDRPFMITESGNNIPEVLEFMQQHGYVSAVRDGDRIRPSDEPTPEHRGYWFHEDHRKMYSGIGLLSS